MTLKISCGIALLVLVVVIGLFRNEANAQQKSSTVSVSTPEGKEMETYLGLRNLALTKKGEPGAKSNEPLAVLMDLPTKAGTATIVAYADGTTSMYLSGGGGYMGGGQAHPAIREAGAKMLAAAGRRGLTLPLPNLAAPALR